MISVNIKKDTSGGVLKRSISVSGHSQSRTCSATSLLMLSLVNYIGETFKPCEGISVYSKANASKEDNTVIVDVTVYGESLDAYSRTASKHIMDVLHFVEYSLMELQRTEPSDIVVFNNGEATSNE